MAGALRAADVDPMKELVAIDVVFYLGPAGHLRQIRRLRCLPELPEATVATPVSLRSIPLFSPRRFRALATDAHSRVVLAAGEVVTMA